MLWQTKCVGYILSAAARADHACLFVQPNPEILAALESAFYRSFEAVEPTNKRILIALDISGSMAAKMSDSPIEVREAATLMAMVTLRVCCCCCCCVVAFPAEHAWGSSSICYCGSTVTNAFQYIA